MHDHDPTPAAEVPLDGEEASPTTNYEWYGQYNAICKAWKHATVHVCQLKSSTKSFATLYSWAHST